MGNKVYKSYNQQIKILRSRGISINKGSAGSRAKEVLKRENYYNVVNGYKGLFLDVQSSTINEQYKSGVTFDEINALYTFDRDIRIIYLKYLLIIENNLKAVISHDFSNKYGYDNYLKLDNFQCNATSDLSELKRISKIYNLDINDNFDEIKRISAVNNTFAITKLIGEIQQEISRQLSKNHQMVTHYMINHGYIPLWVLVNVLTFGKITNFYLNLKEQDKIDIAKEFGVHYKELHKYMRILGLARNKCAHDERFYDIKFRLRLHTRSIRNFSILGLQRDKSGSYKNGTNDAFAVAIIFSQMLKKCELKEFISSMSKAISKLEKQLNSISINDVLDVMGYPDNWKQLIRIAKN